MDKDVRAISKPRKRSLYRELAAGVEAMREHREGRLVLRTHHVEPTELRPRRGPKTARE